MIVICWTCPDSGLPSDGCCVVQSFLSPLSRLDLWPGFITSILQYEEQIMLCADVSHKIMRADTVYDFLNELFQQYNQGEEFHDRAIKSLVGEIVLTR